MKEHITLRIVILSVLSLCAVEAGISTCQDIDHNGCVAMAAQNLNMCNDHRLATSVCPQFCGQCPIECYNCLATAQNMSQCNTITCAPGEKCMVRSKYRTHGERYYSMICGPKVVCSDFRKRGLAVSHTLQERNIYSICCDQDLCNMPSLFDATTTTTRTTTNMPTTTQNPQTLNQHGCVKDVVIMVEDSSVIYQFLTPLKDSIKSTISKLNVSATQNRIALGLFNRNNASTVWELNSYNSKQEVFNAVDRLALQYPVAWSGYNIFGAKHATDNFMRGNRPNVPDVLIIISQAHHVFHALPILMHPQTYDDIITKMSQRYLDVIAIAAGSADVTEMQLFATDANHYFYIPTSVLLLGGISIEKSSDGIAKMICQV